MAITVDGLVSGLDTTGIITKLIELEQRPIQIKQDKQTQIDDKLAAWQGINGKMLTLETAASKMNSGSEFQAVTGSFTNNDTAASDNIVNLTVNNNIEPGSFNFSINQLAKEKRVLMKQSYSSVSTSTGAGTFNIETANSGTFTFSGSSLSDFASAINSANIHRTATIINTGTTASPQYKLLIANDKTGANWDFTTSTNPSFGGDDYFTFTETQAGQDSQVQLDGATITRSTNTISDLIDGVTFDLKDTGDGVVTFKSNPDQVVSNVNDFVSAYNDLKDEFNKYNYYNASTQEAGTLFGNATLRNIENRLRSVASGIVPGLYPDYHTYSSLSQVGITTDGEGKLQVDSAKLEEAVRSNVSEVTKLFTSSGSGAYTFVSATGATTPKKYDTRVVNNGGQLAVEMRSYGTSNWVTLERDGNFWHGPKDSTVEGLILRAPYSGLKEGDTGVMDIAIGVAEQIGYQTGFFTEFSTQGAIFNERRSLEKQRTKYAEEITSLEQRISLKKQNLVQKYTALESTLAGLKGQGDYLTQQLANLPGLG